MTDRKSDPVMTTHKYAVGEAITFLDRGRPSAAGSGRYQILARRPVSDGEPWYVIRSDVERYDRVVPESDLQ